MTEGQPISAEVFRQRGVNATRRLNAVLASGGKEASKRQLPEALYGTYFGNVIRTHIEGPATGPLRIQAMVLDTSLQLHDEVVAMKAQGKDVTSLLLSLKVLRKLTSYLDDHPDLKARVRELDFVEE